MMAEAVQEVYNSAREGHLHSLRVFLDTRGEEEVRHLVHSTTNGATPLIMACRNGHAAVVEYLVDTCRSNVEQVGSVNFDGEVIDGAPPLWCAAAAGHVDIVRFLVKAGAQVNKTTFTNSTPLRAACFDGHFEIVQFLLENNADMEIANRHGHTCLMISCYKGHLKIVKYLLQRGADVNKKSLKGNTALHDCAEAGSLEIMKLLFEYNAVMAKDSYEMTPLLAAAVTGNTKIVEYLVSRGECTTSCRVEALQLLGATFVDKKRDLAGAVRLWKRALEEARANEEEEKQKVKAKTSDASTQISLGKATPEMTSSLLAEEAMSKLAISCNATGACSAKSPDELCVGTADKGQNEEMVTELTADIGRSKRNKPEPVEAYRNCIEASSVAELDELSTDPDSMRMQALLVRERILGPAHPDTSYYIRYRGAVYADMGDFAWCLQLWTYALDMQQRHLEALSPMTQSSFLSFAELFSFMMTAESKALSSRSSNATIAPAQKVNFSDMMAVFDKAVLELERGMTQVARIPVSERDINNFNRYLLIIVHLIALIGRVVITLTEEQSHRFKSAVYRIVRMNPRGAHSSTPLHLACSKDTTNVGRFPVCAFPDPIVVTTLLEVGANVNAVDAERNTPLHVAAKNAGATRGADVVRALLERGAHLDACNGERRTPVHLLSSAGAGHEVNTVIVSPLHHVTLKCLAARCIIESNVVYRGLVPAKLEAFIRMH